MIFKYDNKKRQNERDLPYGSEVRKNEAKEAAAAKDDTSDAPAEEAPAEKPTLA